MMEDALFAWGALFLLGALHGANPGMGWLFAVALGMQEKDGRAVWRALLPLAAGHALAVGAAVALLVLAGQFIPASLVRWGVAGCLLVMGVLHLRHRLHPRWRSMQVTGRDLVAWSFLMATAHGAGVMALALVPARQAPAVHASAVKHEAQELDDASHAAHASSAAHGVRAAVGAEPSASASRPHAHHAGMGTGGLYGVAATVVHTAGYLLAVGLIAVLVYYRLGLAMLRTRWFNLDVLWASALVLAALVTLATG